MTARAAPSPCSSNRTDSKILVTTSVQAGPTRSAQRMTRSRSHSFHFALSGRSPGFVEYRFLTYAANRGCDETRTPSAQTSSLSAPTRTSTVRPAYAYGAEYQLWRRRRGSWPAPCAHTTIRPPRSGRRATA